MAEPSVINTVVVRNGESFKVSIRPANGPPVSMAESGLIKTVVRNGKPFEVSIRHANGPGSMVKFETSTTAATAAIPASAAVPSATSPAFVDPIVNFMNNVQENYNQPNMTKEAIDKEISRLKTENIPRSFNKAKNLLGNTELRKKVLSGHDTFAEYIKKIIENETERVMESAANAVRQNRLQKNTRPTFFKEKELAAKQEEYNVAFAAEKAQQTRYIAANKTLGDSEKEYPIIFRGLETRVKEANELKEAKQREVDTFDNERKLLQISDPNDSLSFANQQKIDEAENKYSVAFEELKKLTKLQIQRSIIKNKVSTLEDYKAEQERLANIEKFELNKLKQISIQKSKESIEIQQELRTIEAENKKEEDTVKNQRIIVSIKEIIRKVIPLITNRLNEMNEVEKAIKAGLADYLVNRTIDETERDNGTSKQDITRSFTVISNNISVKNDDLQNSIIERMEKAAEKVHYSKLQSLAPYSLDDAAAKAKIKQEFYKMEPPTWEKSIFSGGRRTLRRKNVRRKTRRITRSY